MRRTSGMDPELNPLPNLRAASRRLCAAPEADGLMRFLRMHQLWELAAGLPVKQVRLSELIGVLDEVCWFGGPLKLQPTCRAVAEHARDIYAAALSYPIILPPAGEVLDGLHRICQAFLQGLGRDRCRAVAGAAAPSLARARHGRGRGDGGAGRMNGAGQGRDEETRRRGEEWV